MDSLPIWIGLLLLVVGSTSAQGEASTTEDTLYDERSTTPVTPHPCHCSHITYGKDEMEGNVKNPGYPNAYCNDQKCSFEIEPHPNLSIVLSIELISMEERYDRLDFFHYRLQDGKMDKIFFTNLGTTSFKWFLIPPRVGVFLNMTSDQSNVGRFLLGFTRSLAGSPATKGYSCPYPFVTPNAMFENISMASWPPSGCSVRVSSNQSISLRFVCNSGLNVGMYIRATLPGQTAEYWTESVSDFGKYDRNTSSADLIIRGIYTYYGFTKSAATCRMTYFSLNFNPCNCSNTEYVMNNLDSIEIKSPGFPNLYCPSFNCVYKFSRTNLTKDMKSAFIVSAVQFPQNGDDNLVFNTRGERESLLQTGQHESEKQVIVAENLEITYFASTQYKNFHGFQAYVMAIDERPECVCPSNGPKALPSKGSYYFPIPPQCKEMTCRFVIGAEYSLLNTVQQAIRLLVDYKFNHPDEKLTVFIGDEERVFLPNIEGAVNREKMTVFTNSRVIVIYSRQADPYGDIVIPSSPSNFNMSWSWLSRRDCSCDRNIHIASASFWEEIFSPRYPDDYCLQMNCYYRIQAPEGYHVILNISFFETEPHSDYLYIFNGFNTSAKHEIQLSGHIVSTPLFESSGPNVSMLFVTDASITSRGFVINYKAVKDLDTDSDNGGGHGWLFLMCFLAVGCIIGGGFYGYNKKFKKPAEPVYVPNYRYSISEDSVVEETET